MTIPSERRRSIEQAREFLRRLLDPKATPKVPRAVRKEAYWALRHYPSELDMALAATNFDKVFGKENEE